MKCSLLFLFVFLYFFCVSAQQQQATTAASRLAEWYNPREGQFNGVGWWHSGNCLTALAEWAQRSGNSTFTNSIIEAMFPLNGNFTTEGYDDEGWWGLGWIAAYKLTQTASFLDRAEAIFADMELAWSTDCGGGIWWNRAKTYKNAITNELFLSLAAELYLATKQETYLNWARQEWQWFNKSGMINSQNLINDGLTNDCKNNGQPTWTYNQGVVLGGLASLYQITNDKDYLVTATQIAQATMTILSPKGILQEICEPSKNCDGDQVQFKGIFMRNLAYLYQATQSQTMLNYIHTNAQSIWNNDSIIFQRC
eukprot:Phypoly_transcript_11029.p1 GENE.Phypoly_transcript_11029~~Phypoly_transcript_11029.p1  ORF type:complete len:310 (+),score=30.78 Phypoly_transcript_11029:13-942(+)